MKAALVLALGLVSSAAFAYSNPKTHGVTCHQGYEYKTATVQGKTGFVPTGVRCNCKGLTRWW